jgi:hypothetical protein
MQYRGGHGRCLEGGQKTMRHAPTLPRVAPALVGLTALLALACAENPAASSVAAGSQFLLRTGEKATLEDSGLSVRFDAVANDSRCPADAVCVTLGDAAAVFSAGEAGRPAASLTLHTAPGEGRSAVVGGFVLTLTRLDPYPYAGRPIRQSEYQAWLRVDRAAGYQ